MQFLPIEARDGVAAGEVERLLAAGAFVHGVLADLIRWGAAQAPPARLVEIIVQDEYTHDVVYAVGAVHLVYDTT